MDEFEAISRKMAEEINIDIFDATTFDPERLMYWTSTSSDGEFYFHYQEGSFLDPDIILNKYDDWRDMKEWAYPAGAKKREAKDKKKVADPLSKKGVVGLFNRAYPILTAIDSFLSDVYEPSDIEDRYSYIPASSSRGLKIYPKENLVYSFHAKDPAHGRTLNAFDLVRIHKFGDMDEDAKEGTNISKLPSFQKMSEFAYSLPEVKVLKNQELKEELEELDQPSDDWMDKLEYQPRNPGTLTRNAKNSRFLLAPYHDSVICSSCDRINGTVPLTGVIASCS